MASSLTIVLLGNTGVGKSASGNTIFGGKMFESKRCFRSVTTEITKKTKTLFDKQISVVDTPDILSTGSEENIKQYCEKHWLSSENCVFLVVVKIDRFTKEQKQAVDAAIRVLGDQRLKKSYILFTGGDILEDASIDNFIQADEEGFLRRLIRRFDERYHVFNNEEAGQMQVEELLNKFQTSQQESGSQDNLARRPVPERRIVLFGLPGAGKSSSGNTILDSESFAFGPEFNPVTMENSTASKLVEGRNVIVVDTPGLNKVTKALPISNRKLFNEIKNSANFAHPGPHALVFVVKLGRISQADCLILKHLPKMFSSNAFNYSIVLFTNGEELKHRSLSELIEGDENIKELLFLCGGRYCVFDNKRKRDRLQVRELLDKIDEIVLNNQGEHISVANLTPTAEAIKWKAFLELLEKIWDSLNCCRRPGNLSPASSEMDLLIHSKAE